MSRRAFTDLFDPDLADLSSALEREAQRAARSGGSFCVLRIALAGRPDEDECRLVRTAALLSLRRSDVIGLMGPSEIGVILADTAAAQVQAPLNRVRHRLARRETGAAARFGWAAVGPSQRCTWQEAWRNAGSLLLAAATVEAAA